MVGLVPFRLRIRLPRGPALPWIGEFPETNVRTYVRGPDGESGIWFLSLEAPRRIAIWMARITYHLPYQTAAMRMQCHDNVRCYASWRIEGEHRGASSRARVTFGDPVPDHEVTPLERFLTERWRLYAPLRHGIGAARVDHGPWTLRRGSADDVDTHLLLAVGLPVPAGPPLVHACDDIHAALTSLAPCRQVPQIQGALS